LTGFSQSKTLRSDWSIGRKEWSTLPLSWMHYIGCRSGTESTLRSPHLTSAVFMARHQLIWWNWYHFKQQRGVGFVRKRTLSNSSFLLRRKFDGESALFLAVHPGFGMASLLNSALFPLWLVFDPD
jgi:hypothetical protein